MDCSLAEAAAAVFAAIPHVRPTAYSKWAQTQICTIAAVYACTRLAKYKEQVMLASLKKIWNDAGLSDFCVFLPLPGRAEQVCLASSELLHRLLAPALAGISIEVDHDFRSANS